MTSVKIVKPIKKSDTREKIGQADTLFVITVDGSPVACIVEKSVVASVLARISAAHNIDSSRIKITETPVI